MKITDGKMTSINEEGDMDERVLCTYDDEERQNNEINKENAKLLFSPKFIPFYPELLDIGLNWFESIMFGFIDFITGNAKKGRFYFSNSDLSELFRCSEDTISRAISALVKKGLISTRIKIKAGGGQIRFINITEKNTENLYAGMRTLSTQKCVDYNNKELNKNKINKNKIILHTTKNNFCGDSAFKKNINNSSNADNCHNPLEEKSKNNAIPIPALEEDRGVFNEVAPKNEINRIMGEFYKINPSLNFGHSGQRKACLWLIDHFRGINASTGQLEALIGYAGSILGERYAPVITTPLEMKNKLVQLKAYIQKNNNSSSKGIRIV